MVDDEIINGAVADDGADVVEILSEESDVDRIDKDDFLIVDEILVVRHALRQEPKSLEAVLHTVVDAHIMYFPLDVHVVKSWFVNHFPPDGPAVWLRRCPPRRRGAWRTTPP